MYMRGCLYLIIISVTYEDSGGRWGNTNPHGNEMRERLINDDRGGFSKVYRF